MYRKIPLENAQRIINLTASEKEITLQKARMTPCNHPGRCDRRKNIGTAQ